MQPQLPYQAPVRHRHHQHLCHHHHHFFPPPINQHHHHCHVLGPHSVPSLPLCPNLLHHLHRHGLHRAHQFSTISFHPHLHAAVPGKLSSVPPNPCPIPASFSEGSGYPGVMAAAEVLDSESGAKQYHELEALEEEELDDIFVLTDEWKEFFAKSEAKRRMEKQQKNKHRK